MGQTINHQPFADWFDRNKLTPRKQQVEVLNQIFANPGKKYYICDCPTGVGKQFIAQATAAGFKDSFLLNSSKQLQDQYLNGPEPPTDLRGRGNYQCRWNPTLTAESAPCTSMPHLISNCIRQNCCLYYKQRDLAMNAPIFSTNYHYFLYARLCGPLSAGANHGVPVTRDLLISDEAHELENVLVGFAETKLDPVQLEKEFGLSDLTWRFTGDKRDNFRIVQDIYATIQTETARLLQEKEYLFKRHGLTSQAAMEKIPTAVMNQIKEVTKNHSALDKFEKRLGIFFRTLKQSQWIIHADDKNTLILSPMNASGLFDEFLGDAARKFLFLSATIGSPKAFAKELGLPFDECCFITTDTDFPKENSPVVPIAVGKFNYNSIDATLPKAIKVIDQILDLHKGDKGIIHSVNYRITDEIFYKSKHRARLLSRQLGYKFPLNNDKLLRMHIEKKEPTVLVSPSMNTGISLDDNLARFQIIVKLPFASMGDPRVKAKMEEDRDWYTNKMWQEIMQASGRATRSAEDFSITYILDESLFYFLDNAKDLPKWFRERIQDK